MHDARRRSAVATAVALAISLLGMLGEGAMAQSPRITPVPHRKQHVMKGGFLPSGGVEPANREPGGACPPVAPNSSKADRKHPKVASSCAKNAHKTPSRH